jgi:hypothetical protein
MNIKCKDCNYDVYEHMSKLLGVSNFRDDRMHDRYK